MTKRQITWNSPAVVFAVVFCLVLATGTFVSRELLAKGSRKPANTAPTFVADWREIAAAGQQAGHRMAPVTVVVFTDYQCPGCAEFHRQLTLAKDSLGDSLRVVTRHYPLSIHAHAKAAANAAECAAEQGRFDAMQGELYRSQDSIGAISWLVFASRAGVRDTQVFARCVKASRHAPTVERDTELARKLKFAGTPAYLVNGVAHFGAPQLPALMTELREAAKRAPAAAMSADGQAHNGAIALAQSAKPVVRRWLSPPVHERTITGDVSDELLIPSNLSLAQSGELVLFDFGSMELRAIALDGVTRWRSGRKGSGPGEFRNAMDVEVRANGHIAVLDMANRRITTVSPRGRVIRTIPVKVSSPRFIPLPDTTTFALAAEDTSSLWLGVNQAGDTLRREMSPPSLWARHGMEREMFTAPTSHGAAVAFRWSDKIALLDARGSVERIVDGIEPIAFPGTKAYPLKSGRFKGQSFRISPDAVSGALSVSARDDELYVLFAGASAERGRIVDMYDVRDGSYAGSRLLPFPALELVALPGGRVAVLRNEPVPSIDILRFSASPAPRVAAKR